MKSKPRVDSFGTFLDHTVSGSVYIGRPPRSQDLDKYKYGDEASSLLSVVAAADTIEMPELLAKSQLPLRVFTEALEVLKDKQLVATSGPPGREVVMATPEGKGLVAAAA